MKKVATDLLKIGKYVHFVYVHKELKVKNYLSCLFLYFANTSICLSEKNIDRDSSEPVDFVAVNLAHRTCCCLLNLENMSGNNCTWGFKNAFHN